MPGNMANLMKQAQKMQKQMEEQAKEMEEKSFTATAGGGAVEVTVSGKKEVQKVKLQEEVVDPDDVEMLEDLIMAAVNEALRQINGATNPLEAVPGSIRGDFATSIDENVVHASDAVETAQRGRSSRA